MKKIIIPFLFCTSFLMAQENQGQGIELPDFVITGKENVSVPKMEKSKPDLIPLLSKDFFTPTNISDEQTSINLPELENKIMNIPSYRQKTNALLRLNAGLHTWPSGEFYYNDWKDNFSYSANIFGLNELEYVKKAGLSYAGLGLGSKYFIRNDADFLPGLEIDLNGNYLYESYNFYGSQNPNIDRKTNDGYAELGFNFVTDHYRKFGITFNDRYYNQKDDAISENIFGTQAYVGLKIMDFDFKIEGSFKNQTITSDLYTKGNNYYFNTKATLGVKPFSFMNIKGGIYLAESEGNTFFAPHAYGSIKFNKSLSLFGEFSPFTEFVTLSDFRDNNRFYQMNKDFVNLFVENKFNLKVAAKFEYEKYFEISGGVGYVNSDNNFYFDDNIDDGFFTIYKDDIETSFAFMNFIFRKGPFGEFYGDVKIQDVTGSNSKDLPYNSPVIANLNYAYSWTNFKLGFNLNYLSKTFTDRENTNEIPRAFNLGMNLSYEIFQNFDLTLAVQNMFNDKYYYFRNYKAKPVDVIAGFEFRW